MSIKSEIDRIANNVSDIRTALINHGMNAEGHNTNDFANDIAKLMGSNYKLLVRKAEMNWENYPPTKRIVTNFSILGHVSEYGNVSGPLLNLPEYIEWANTITNLNDWVFITTLEVEGGSFKFLTIHIPKLNSQKYIHIRYDGSNDANVSYRDFGGPSSPYAGDQYILFMSKGYAGNYHYPGPHDDIHIEILSSDYTKPAKITLIAIPYTERTGLFDSLL